MKIQHLLIVTSVVTLANCDRNTNKLADMNHTTTSPNQSKSFTATILVNKSAGETFDAISNFRGWWSEDIEGNTDQLNETFFYHYKDIHLCKMKLIEAIPGKKLVYRVLENEFNFIRDKSEWVNTRLVFDISTAGSATQVRFTHDGLVPEYEYYNVCNDAWSGYINNSLKSYIDTGKGSPNPKDKDGFNAELARKWGLTADER